LVKKYYNSFVNWIQFFFGTCSKVIFFLIWWNLLLQKKARQPIFAPPPLLLLLESRSEMDKNQDLGSGMNFPEPQHCWCLFKCRTINICFPEHETTYQASPILKISNYVQPPSPSSPFVLRQVGAIETSVVDKFYLLITYFLKLYVPRVRHSSKIFFFSGSFCIPGSASTYAPQ
jgi:hypothetical protein